MIVRGSTPTHVFNFPHSIDNVKEAFITYKQDGRVVLDKRLADAKVDKTAKTISLRLTQENTMAFVVNRKPKDNIVEIQVKLLFNNGEVVHSHKIRERVQDGLLDAKAYAGSGSFDDDDSVIWDGGEFPTPDQDDSEDDYIWDGGGVF